MDRCLDQAKPDRSRQVADSVTDRMNEATWLIRPVAKAPHLPGPMRKQRKNTARHHTAPDIEPTRCRAVPAGRMPWETRPMSGNA